jgi:hypothetical protein
MALAFQETVLDFVSQTDDGYVAIDLFGASPLPSADFEPTVLGASELLDRRFRFAAGRGTGGVPLCIALGRLSIAHVFQKVTSILGLRR